MATNQTNSTKTGSGKLFLLAVLYTAFQLIGVILTTKIIGFDLSWVLESALMVIMCFALCFTYRSHTKNVMKPMLGAALMLLLTTELSRGGYYLQYVGQVTKIFAIDAAFAGFATAQILLFFVVAGINIMHYVINADHHSNPKKVKFNRALCVIFVVLVVVQCIYFASVDDPAVLAVGDCLACFADVFALGIVICIEGSLDEFRIAREEKAKAAEEAEN